MTSYTINYEALQKDLDELAPTQSEKEQFLLDELPYAWRRYYLKMSTRTPVLLDIPYKNFTYYFDYYSDSEQKAQVCYSEEIEDRVVAVIGRSNPRLGARAKRVNSWLRGLIAGTEKRWGAQFDKGHYIADSIGGGEQLNVFPQRRDVNRGRSEQGKRFRKMEHYCFLEPGTIVFHRPIYLDESARPTALDFGLLMTDGNLWVERFDNREVPDDGVLFQSKVPKGPQLNSWVTRLQSRNKDSG